MFVLHVRLPDNSERQNSLPSGELALLGRGNASTIRLDDPSMSRVHCRLLARGGRVILTDAGSRWGSFVNGQRVDETEVRPGDEIELGETLITLRTEGRPEATTVAPPIKRAKQLRRARAEEPDEHFDTATASAFDSAIVADAVFDSEPPAPVKEPAAAAISEEGLTSDRVATGEKVQKSEPSIQFAATFCAETFLNTRFVRYDVQVLVADARMGLVFRALDTEADRPVALKLFRPEVLEDQRDRQRFLRGIRTMLPLKHENLVQLYAAGRFEGICYTATEFVNGESAAEMIQRIGVGGMLDAENVLRIALHIARALEFAEEKRIVHRNITPQNILVRSSDKSAKLGDLMFARALDGTSAERITQAGELVGELSWMSPEVAGSGNPIDTRSDLYSLGTVLYALLTGRPPLEGRGPAQTIQMILEEEPAPPTTKQLSIPALFEGVVMQLLEKRPEDRPKSARQLVRDLERVAKYEGMKME